MMPADLRLFLFGTPRFEYRGEVVEVERRKALGLAAYLALAQQPQSRDGLAGLFWPGLNQERARTALRSTLPALTTLAEESWLLADRMNISIKHEAIWIDVYAFIDLLAQSRVYRPSIDDHDDHLADLYQQAIMLYRDDFMGGFTLAESAEYDDWQTFQREWLRREFAGILRWMAQHCGHQGEFEHAIGYAQRWLAVDTLHEPAHRLLMRLYTLNGQRTEALRQYQVCTQILNTELAATPETETTELYEVIRTHQPTLNALTASEESTSSILPPLPPLMIGRETVLAHLKQRLGAGGSDKTHPVTVIQGWPGVGKSTLLAALAHDTQVAQIFPDGILWASLGENPYLLDELSRWAAILRLDAPRKLEGLTTQLTAALRHKRVLLLLDDVWQVEHAKPFKVGGPGCALIITSRLNDVAEALSPTSRDVYRLPVLPEEQALALLCALAPEAISEHPNEAYELVRDLEGLPLALQVAGRLLRSEARLGWGVGELLEELRRGANLLGAQAPGDMIGVWDSTTPTIAALLQRSTDSLDIKTRQYYAFLGLLVPNPAAFDLQTIATAWDMADPRPIVRTLVNRGLLEPLHDGRFQMHTLLVLHARSLLGL